MTIIALFSLFVFYIMITNFERIGIISKILIICLALVLFAISQVLKYKKYLTAYKLLFFANILYIVIFLSYALLIKYNILTIFSSVSNLKNYILSTGSRGVLVYILLQAGQVVFLPIPAAIICIVGSLIYGPFMGGVYCSIGVLLGSFISFFIGKTCGYKIVKWIVGKEATDKYSSIIRKRGSFFLCLAFLLPMFPDDILCLIAGITNMSLLSFSWVTILTRPIGVICMAYFGSGMIIPFTGWGLYVWCGILIIAVAIVYITYRYQEQMQNYILGRLFKKRHKNLK